MGDASYWGIYCVAFRARVSLSSVLVLNWTKLILVRTLASQALH